MTDCHDHVDFKANPSLSKWEENILRLSLIRKFVLNISEKFPKSEVYEKIINIEKFINFKDQNERRRTDS